MKTTTTLKALTALALTTTAGSILAAANNFHVTLNATPAAQALMGPNTQVEMKCGHQTSMISLGSVLGATTNYFSGNQAKCTISLKENYGLYKRTPGSNSSGILNIKENKSINYEASVPNKTLNVTYASPIMIRDVVQTETIHMTLASAPDADGVANHQLIINLDAKKNQ